MQPNSRAWDPVNYGQLVKEWLQQNDNSQDPRSVALFGSKAAFKHHVIYASVQEQALSELLYRTALGVDTRANLNKIAYAFNATIACAARRMQVMQDFIAAVETQLGMQPTYSTQLAGMGDLHQHFWINVLGSSGHNYLGNNSTLLGAGQQVAYVPSLDAYVLYESLSSSNVLTNWKYIVTEAEQIVRGAGKTYLDLLNANSWVSGIVETAITVPSFTPLAAPTAPLTSGYNVAYIALGDYYITYSAFNGSTMLFGVRLLYESDGTTQLMGAGKSYADMLAMNAQVGFTIYSAMGQSAENITLLPE